MYGRVAHLADIRDKKYVLALTAAMGKDFDGIIVKDGKFLRRFWGRDGGIWAAAGRGCVPASALAPAPCPAGRGHCACSSTVMHHTTLLSLVHTPCLPPCS